MKCRLFNLAAMVVFMLSGAPHSFAQTAGNPIVILVESDPWLSVIGSDSPSFALYDNRRVIFKHITPDNKAEYRYVDLPEADYESLLSAFELNENLAELENDYDLTTSTDETTQQIYLKLSNGIKAFRIFGSLKQEEDRAKAPQEIVALFDRIVAFEASHSQKWLPDKIEVMLWPYEYAPEPSILWPTKWPDLMHAETKKREHGAYSIYIASEHLDEVKTFLSSRREKGAIEVNGKKWAASIRLPFPQEQLWMSEFKK